MAPRNILGTTGMVTVGAGEPSQSLVLTPSATPSAGRRGAGFISLHFPGAGDFPSLAASFPPQPHGAAQVCKAVPTPSSVPLQRCVPCSAATLQRHVCPCAGDAPIPAAVCPPAETRPSRSSPTPSPQCLQESHSGWRGGLKGRRHGECQQLCVLAGTTGQASARGQQPTP